MVDLDQSGTAFQQAKTYLGPSLGWVMTQVKSSRNVIAAGATNLVPGDSLILVSVAGLVTINLPDVGPWVLESFQRPATGFERAIWIKDMGGNAALFPITVDGFGAQDIDHALTATINTNFGLLRLYPLNDLTGWFAG